MVVPSQIISVPHPSGALGSMMQGFVQPAATGFSAQGSPPEEQELVEQLCGQLPEREQEYPVPPSLVQVQQLGLPVEEGAWHVWF
jgi:hypothetical protein